jgi:hypothetical protein
MLFEELFDFLSGRHGWLSPQTSYSQCTGGICPTHRLLLGGPISQSHGQRSNEGVTSRCGVNHFYDLGWQMLCRATTIQQQRPPLAKGDHYHPDTPVEERTRRMLDLLHGVNRQTSKQSRFGLVGD